MLCRLVTLLALLSPAVSGCGKRDAEAVPPPAPVIDAKKKVAVANTPAAASNDEKRRGRRGIETATSSSAPSLFEGAPDPPAFLSPPDGATPRAGPAPHAMPPSATRTSPVGLLAAHLRTMRKLRAGILSDTIAVSVYDAGHKRAVFNREALLQADGRWLSARISRFVPKPVDAAVRGAVGTVALRDAGWRIVYIYVDNRWRWSEVWRDRP